MKNLLILSLLLSYIFNGFNSNDEAISVPLLNPEEQVIFDYLEATGGVAAHEAIEDYTFVRKATISGSEYEITETHKTVNKHKSNIFIDSELAQIALLNPSGGKIYFTPFSGAAFDTLIIDEVDHQERLAIYSSEREYDQLGVSLQLDGTEVINGNNAHKLLVTFPGESIVHTNYYDVQTGLKVRHTRLSENPKTGDEIVYKEDYSDYRQVDGDILIPHTIQTDNGMIPTPVSKISNFEANTGVSDSDFE